MLRPLSIISRWLLSSRLVTQLLWPLAVTLPTVLLAATQLQNLPAVEAYTKGLKDYFNRHLYVALACLAWTIILVVLNWWLYPQIERFRRKTDSLNADELAEMLLYSDNVVGLNIARECKRGNASRYAVSAEDLHPSGSMICYPIYHRQLGFVPYVLSVKCGKKNHFTMESRTRYEYLLRPFSHRILLEYSLNTIKEKVT